jgi:O-methyltransferase
VKRLAAAALERIGLGPLAAPIAPDLAPTIDRVADFTMATDARVASMCDAVRYVVEHDIPGDVVECGVWRGGMMMAAALTLRGLGAERRLWLYDTFDGMPEPDPVLDGRDAHRRWRRSRPRRAGSDWCLADLDDVTANMASLGYSDGLIRFVEGPVEETIPGTMPDRIAVLRLDTDWYQSTRHELEHLAPLVTPVGVLIIDDYGHWKGARQAVDEWLEGWPRPVLLHRVDYTGRAAVL